MSTPIYSIQTKIYPSDTTEPQKIELPFGFRQVTLTTQPIDVVGEVSGNSLTELLEEENAVANTEMTGTVEFKATPPRTYHEYTLPEGTVDLSNPTFVTTDIPVETVTVTLQGVTGSSHVAVTAISYI